MIALSRHRALQRITASLLLAVTLFLPLQLSYACELMPGQVSQQCCCGDAGHGCEHGGGCAGHFPDAVDTDNCCRISLDTSPEHLVSATSFSGTLLIDNSPADPPLLLPRTTCARSDHSSVPLLTAATAGSVFIEDHLTYLRTRRFRI